MSKKVTKSSPAECMDFNGPFSMYSFDRKITGIKSIIAFFGFSTQFLGRRGKIVKTSKKESSFWQIPDRNREYKLKEEQEDDQQICLRMLVFLSVLSDPLCCPFYVTTRYAIRWEGAGYCSRVQSSHNEK